MEKNIHNSHRGKKTDDGYIPHIPPAAFDFMTKYYDTITEVFGFGKSFKRRIFDMLNAQDGETVLDIGAGTGTFLSIAAQELHKSRLIGVDPDRNALTIAKRKLASVGLRVLLYEASAEHLPLPDETVDACVSTLVFHHLPRLTKAKAIEEIYRVTKPGGRFLLVDFGKQASILGKILLFVGSFIDGRENVKANLEGIVPIYLQKAGFTVSEVAKPYRGVTFLLAQK